MSRPTALLVLLVLLPFHSTAAERPLTNWLLLTVPVQFAPDAATEAAFHPGGKVTLGGHEFEWKAAGALTPPSGPTVAYAWTEFEAPGQTSAVLSLSTTISASIRLNGIPIERGMYMPVELHSGKNQLLLKAQTAAVPWTFSCSLTSKQGLVEQLVGEALGRGDVATSTSLLESKVVDINAVNRDGLSALQAARIKGHAELATYLLSQGADPGRPKPSPQALTDSHLAQLVRRGDPGIAVLVAQKGRVLFEKSYGLADIKHGVPVRPNTIFRVGSITKQFTASSILLLQEDGRLSVADTLSKYFPDFPHGDQITLAQLLSHTSGIHNYTEHPDFLETVSKPIVLSSLIESFRNDPLDFPPGTKWYYSNSNYVLLAAIIEKVSGQKYADFLRRRLFAPLGLRHTGISPARGIVGYQFSEGKFVEAVPWDMSRAIGAGCLSSTVEDLFRWNEALFHGKVVDEDDVESALRPARPDPQSGGGYGYGFFVSTFRGAKQIHHGGSLHGFSSFLLRVPEYDLTVVVLANSLPLRPGIDTARLAHDVAEFYIGEQLSPRIVPQVHHNLPAGALDTISGRYDYGSAIMAVSVEGGRTYTQLAGQSRVELFPRSAAEFFWKDSDAQITFVKDSSGKVRNMLQYQDGYTIDAPRLATLDEAGIQAIVGQYDCSIHGKSILTITRDGNRIYAQETGKLSNEIFPRTTDVFYWKGLDSDITFVKNAAGKAYKAIRRQGGVLTEAPKVE